ncbi:iron ABC transporter permease [Myroides guanonis]|uniref:Iron complex transport system permease protein n=1 Tax=Myroides guanonis TaxID=1150112 RepID=A0A1I3QTR2_9FLAO|nr:iron ABC transporter permease [Myroides guanonis]SFJ36497.1 iron complex transport system permease protein [Myroides guanonis]
MKSSKYDFLWILVPLLLLAIWGNVSLGAIKIPQKELFLTFMSESDVKSSWVYIIQQYRVPKMVVSILVGVSLSVSGLLMQTLFRNPMAGPYVLGLSSGAGLGVALVLLGSSLLPIYLQELFQSAYAVVIASIIGSLLLLFSILLLARSVSNSMTLLIIGLMFGSFANSMVAVLTYYSSAEELKRFTFWSLGNLGNLSWTFILIFGIVTFVGVVLSICSVKSLDALMLGERYASSMGISIKKARVIIILATGILAGVCTAFVGPIAFVGLAVPHISRLLFKVSNHKEMIIVSSLIGAILMLFCDALTQFPGQSFILPINAITSILGAPLVIGLLLRKR